MLLLLPKPPTSHNTHTHTYSHSQALSVKFTGTYLALSEVSVHQYLCSWKHIQCDICSHLSCIFYWTFSLPETAVQSERTPSRMPPLSSCMISGPSDTLTGSHIQSVLSVVRVGVWRKKVSETEGHLTALIVHSTHNLAES